MPIFNTATTLIVFALDIEAQGLFDDLNLHYSGVGKVNAAYQLMRRLALWREQHGKDPDMVLNLGSAGSRHFNTGSVVNCTRFVQRDFDVTALGNPPFVTPFDSSPTILNNGQRFSDHPEATCGTGDNFMTGGMMTAWNIVDMESYALAKICWLEKITFGCLKYITDGADGHAATSWETGLKDTAENLRRAVDKLFG